MAVILLCGGSFELSLLLLIVGLLVVAIPTAIGLGFTTSLVKLIRELLAARR
ncbi:MAG TPA: hypothetical protein VM870_05510 [Pyrinomonadaceae bacterium]|jgi:hypothetical protein|nr:hypothetical protein [Pyrinomonadaceae bacterium]